MTKRNTPHQNTPRPTAEQMAERRRRAAARSAEAERKRENHKKIVLGAIARRLAEDDGALRARIVERIEPHERRHFPEWIGTTGAGEEDR